MSGLTPMTLSRKIESGSSMHSNKKVITPLSLAKLDVKDVKYQTMQ